MPRGICVFALLCLIPLRSAAQVPVGVLPLSLEGDLTEQSQPVVLQVLEAALSDRGSSLSTVSHDPPCGAGAQCYVDLARQLSVAALLRITMSQYGQMYAVDAELRNGWDGQVAASSHVDCDVCTWTEAQGSVAQAARQLAGSLPGLVDATISPAAAELTIAGRSLDRTGPLYMSPGVHSVRVSGEGYVSQTVQITVHPGQRANLVLSLEPHDSGAASTDGTSAEPTDTEQADGSGAEPNAAVQRSSRRLLLWAGLSMGAAAGAMIAGVLWLALEGQCAIGSSTREGICVDVYYTWPQGLAVTTAGAVLASVSIALFVMRRKRSSAAGTVAFGLAPSAQGFTTAVVGLF